MQDLFNRLQSIGTERLLWATDFDLTLVEKPSDPNGMPLQPELAQNCKLLDDATGGKFYIITGRELESLDRVFAPVNFKASTEYHNRMRFDLANPPVDIADRPQWDLIDADLEALVAKWNIIMRKKPFMRTIYYHKSPLAADVALRQTVTQEIQTILDRLQQQTGHVIANRDGGSVFDLGPAGTDKASAYADVMAHAQDNHKTAAPIVPLYFGDSPGDLPAAQYVKSIGGIFVSVGSDARVTPLADYKLDTPATCRALIEAVVKAPKAP